MARIQIDELLFECPVCIEQFDESCKMLPCQHVFCLNCLEKIYEADRYPDCPTCRQQVMTPISQLQRPILLLALLEKVKAESQKVNTDNLQTAIDLSLKTYQTQQKDESSAKDQEVLQLQIALCKSEEEALFGVEKQSLIDEKEKLEYEITVLKSGKSNNPLLVPVFETKELSFGTHPSGSVVNDTDAINMNITNRTQEADCGSTFALQSSCSTAVKLDTDSENDTFVDTCSSLITEQFEQLLSTDETSDDADSAQITEQFEQLFTDGTKHSFRDVLLNIPDGLLKCLTSPDQELVLREIVAVMSNDGKFDKLTGKELKNYLKTVDDCLTALKYYRRNSLTTVYDGSGDSASNTCTLEGICNSVLLNDEFGCSGSIQSEDLDADDRELSYALELSRQSSMCRSDDELLALTMKKSEMLDVVDKLEVQLFNMKEKLELSIILLVSAGLTSLD